MPSLLDRLERQFYQWSIPGLIRYLALLFVGVFLLTAMNPEFATTLDFNWPKIQEGEWWRLATFIFAPQIGSLNALSILFLICGTMLMFSFSDGLEQQWGVFRTNLYVAWGLLSTLIANILFATILGIHFGMSGVYLGASILFAFATYNPKYSIMLFMVVPCPIWIIAACIGVLMLFQAIASPLHGVFVAACISNYLLVSLPMLLSGAKNRSATSARRKKFKAHSKASNEAFHTCSVCGANDITHPHKTFRVGKDGKDYCCDHLPDA